MICPKYNALVFAIFRTNLFLATHSETNCSSLLSVAVISVAVAADVYSVESSTLHGSTRLLACRQVMGQDSCPEEFLILPGLSWRGFHEITPSVFC